MTLIFRCKPFATLLGKWKWLLDSVNKLTINYRLICTHARAHTHTHTHTHTHARTHARTRTRALARTPQANATNTNTNRQKDKQRNKQIQSSLSCLINFRLRWCQRQNNTTSFLQLRVQIPVSQRMAFAEDPTLPTGSKLVSLVTRVSILTAAVRLYAMKANGTHLFQYAKVRTLCFAHV